MAIPRALWRTRCALAAALTLAALATVCATARADGYLRIVPVGGAGARTIDLSQVPGGPDVHDRAYSTVATPFGTPQMVTVRSGYSLPKLLADARISSTFEAAEVPAPEGPSVILSYPQATSPGAYQSSGGPPVVWADGAGVHFLVPRTPSGATRSTNFPAGPPAVVRARMKL